MNKISHDSETPAQGQQVMSACAFIHHDFDGIKKILLAKRADTKKFLPGVFEMPGGHIDYGEDIVDGLKREIMEEFGMTVSMGDPFYVFTYQNKIKGSHTIEVIYFAQFNEPIESVTINPEDHSSFEWFSEEDVVKRRKEIVSEEFESHQQGDDPEYLTLLKGFALLKGDSLKFK